MLGSGCLKNVNSRVPFHQADKFRINLIDGMHLSIHYSILTGSRIQNGQDFDFIKMASVTPPIIGVFDKCPFHPRLKTLQNIRSGSHPCKRVHVSAFCRHDDQMIIRQ